MSSQTGSSIVEFGARSVESVTLDEMIDEDEKVTFIKLDIEDKEEETCRKKKCFTEWELLELP